jgi:hypothetical protein
MKIVFISDNYELIRRLKVHKHYDEPYPNEKLKSKFDVTEQISPIEGGGGGSLNSMSFDFADSP